MGSAGTPAEGIKLATHEELEGALLSVKLQESGGRQVAEYLRSRMMPVVLVSGYDSSSLDPCLRDLRKPTLLSDLVEQVAAHRTMGNSRSRRFAAPGDARPSPTRSAAANANRA